VIPQVELSPSGLKTSRLGFGTSRLHYVEGTARARLLETAVDLGLTHIDTAPSYGDTLAEFEIGRVLKGRRDGIVIATKYGIPPDPLIAALPALAFPLRAGRALLRVAGLAPRRRTAMTPTGLRRSVEASLRRLRVDSIDVLLLHEPQPTSLPSIEPIGEELNRLRQEGLIRHFGLAGSWRGIAALGEAGRALGGIVQTGEGEWPETDVPDITYGAMASGPQSFTRKGLDPAVALGRLGAALARRPSGVVLVSTSEPERLRTLAAAAQEAMR
jgi:aryl-alcohol dehydrogenase-like predicted oxidoreductase